MDRLFNVRVFRSGGALGVRVPERVVDYYSPLPGDSLRVRFSRIKLRRCSVQRWTIPYDSMVPADYFSPVLDPDGVTWTVRVRFSGGGCFVRVPPELSGCFIDCGDVLRLGFVGIVPETASYPNHPA